MKKLLLIVSMMVMLFSMTICAQAEEATLPENITEETLSSNNEQILSFMQQMTSEEAMETMISQYTQYGLNTDWIRTAYDAGLQTNLSEYGAYSGLGEIEVNSTKDGVTVTQILKYDTRDVELEVLYDEEGLTSLWPSSVALNPVFTFGEKMQKAGLNTLLGMGTVFFMLIFISFIISGFKLIPKIQASFTKKGGEQVKVAPAAPAPVLEESVDVTDDFELAAVISAAVAAASQTSTDGFTVRSIKRRRRS